LARGVTSGSVSGFYDLSGLNIPEKEIRYQLSYARH
jgi:hypothetical protein